MNFDELAKQTYYMTRWSIYPQTPPATRRKNIGIKKVVADKQNNVVVVYFNDGEKEVVRTQKGDHFDPYVGASLAITRHIYGTTTKYYNEIDSKMVVVEKKVQNKKENAKENTKKTNKKGE